MIAPSHPVPEVPELVCFLQRREKVSCHKNMMGALKGYRADPVAFGTVPACPHLEGVRLTLFGACWFCGSVPLPLPSCLSPAARTAGREPQEMLGVGVLWERRALIFSTVAVQRRPAANLLGRRLQGWQGPVLLGECEE